MELWYDYIFIKYMIMVFYYAKGKMGLKKWPRGCVPKERGVRVSSFTLRENFDC